VGNKTTEFSDTEPYTGNTKQQKKCINISLKPWLLVLKYFQGAGDDKCKLITFVLPAIAEILYV
jgi:hypothetical protein